MFIVHFLLSLGAHIGSTKYNVKNFYKPFLLGYRKSYSIFNINIVLYYLQKASIFFYTLGFRSCKFLFYYQPSSEWGFFFRGFFFSWLTKTNQFFLDEYWKFGCISNMMTHGRQVFHDLFQFQERSRQQNSFVALKNISFDHFFFRLLFFTFSKKMKIPGVYWNLLMNKIKKYWRFFLFFKFYKHLNRFPDAFLYFTDCNFSYPAIECSNLYIPVVSILDSSFSFYKYVTYPILSNGNSPFLHFFYFISFMKSYENGMVYLYRSFY